MTHTLVKLSAPGDVVRLQRLLERCSDYYEFHEGYPTPIDAGEYELTAAIPSVAAPGDLYVFALENESGTLDGVVQLIRNLPVRGTWWLGLLVVAPELRSHGLGLKLLQHAISSAAAEGATTMMLIVSMKNPRAHKFWEGAGFRDTGEVCTVTARGGHVDTARMMSRPVVSLADVLRDVFSSNADIALAAMHRVAGIVAASVPEVLPQVEETIRASWRSAYYEPHFVEPLLRDSGSSVELLGVLSFHPSGFVREAAVKRLAAVHDGPELRYLLLRLSDWVPEVRTAARQPVMDRIRENNAVALDRNFSLIDRLEGIQRADHASLIPPLIRVFATPEGAAAIRTTLASGSRRTARAVVRFLLDHVPAQIPELVRMPAADAVVRAWFAPIVARALPAAEALSILQRFAEDSSSIVRRESLAALARSFPNEAVTYLERGVLDRSAAVREISRHFFRADFASMYRTAIEAATTTRALASAIAGLSEVGAPSDADVAAPHLSSASASVRRAAVKCVMRLSPERFVERVAASLQDSSRSVSAAARDALKRHAHSLDPSPLMNMLATSPQPHTRRNVVLLLAHLPKWQSITCLLQAAITEDEKVASLAQRFIRNWNRQYNRSQTTPTRQEVAALLDVVTRIGERVDRRTIDEIRFALQAFYVS